MFELVLAAEELTLSEALSKFPWLWGIRQCWGNQSTQRIWLVHEGYMREWLSREPLPRRSFSDADEPMIQSYHARIHSEQSSNLRAICQLPNLREERNASIAAMVLAQLEAYEIDAVVSQTKYVELGKPRIPARIEICAAAQGCSLNRLCREIIK